MRRLALAITALLALPAAAPAADLSLGFGYPYVSVKADFRALAWEARYAAGSGISVYSGRGYWKFHRGRDITGFTGLEGGYIRFNTLGLKGTGYEAGAFIGGQYRLSDNLGLLMDFAPTLIMLRHDVYTDVTVSGLEYVANAAVYFRFGAGKKAGKDGLTWEADEVSEEELLERLGASDPEVRRRAAYELGRISYEEASKPLLKLLSDGDEKVRGVAALALGRLSDDDAVRPLIGMLDDNAAYVRESAAKALGSLREPSAKGALERLTKDKDKRVRAAAADALEKLGVNAPPGRPVAPRPVKKKKKAPRAP